MTRSRWGSVSINVHVLSKHFSFWNSTLNFGMGLFKLPATVWSHFPWCWTREKAVISVCTYSPPGRDQTHTHDYSTYPGSSRHAMQPWYPLLSDCPMQSFLWAYCSFPGNTLPSQPTLTHTTLTHAHFLPGHSHLWTWGGHFIKNCLWWLH